MTIWSMLEIAAWVLSALVAAWLLTDAFRTGRRFDEEFLVHTMEDLGEDAEWQAEAGDAPRGDGSRR